MATTRVYPARSQRNISFTVRKKRSILPRPLRFTRCREHESYLQIDGDLLHVFRNEVRTVVDI